MSEGRVEQIAISVSAHRMETGRLCTGGRVFKDGEQIEEWDTPMEPLTDPLEVWYQSFNINSGGKVIESLETLLSKRERALVEN